MKLQLHHPHLHFHTPFGTLLPHQVNRSVKELFASVGILGFAVSAAMLYEPIYLYTLHYSLLHIVLYNAIMYALYFLLIPLGAKFALRQGVERSIVLGSCVLVVYFLALFSIGKLPMLFFVAPIIGALHKMFYWVGYHADFASFSTKEEVGREIGGMSLVIGVTSMFGPVAGGALAASYGFPVLFIVVAALILLSNIPLLFSPSKSARGNFSYHESYQRLLQKKYRRRVVTALGYGEDFIAQIFWPIFIFLIVAGTVKVGLIVTFSAVITSIVLLYIGKITDLKDRFTVLRSGVGLKSLAWIFRLFVTTPGTVIIADTMYRVAAASTEYPILTDTYNTAKDGDIMKTVVLFEMSLVVGKLLTMGAIALLLVLIPSSPWHSVFLLGAVVSFFYAALAARR